MTTAEELAQAGQFARTIGASSNSRDYAKHPAWLETDAAMLRVLLASKKLLQHNIPAVAILSHPNATEDTGKVFLAHSQEGGALFLGPAFRILGSDDRYASLVPSAFARLQGMKLYGYLKNSAGKARAGIFAYAMDAETEHHAFTKLNAHNHSREAFLNMVLKDETLTEEFIRNASFSFVMMMAKHGDVNLGMHPLQRLRLFIDRLENPDTEQWQVNDHTVREVCLQFLTRVWMHADFDKKVRQARTDAVRAAVVTACPGMLFYFYPLWMESYGTAEKAAIQEWLTIHHPDRAELPVDWAYKLTHPHVNVNWTAFNNYTVNQVMLGRPL